MVVAPDEFEERQCGQQWPPGAETTPYSFLLFGRFQARRAGSEWAQMGPRKIQELVAYLLLFRRQAHHRDVLSAALWASSEPRRARKNLRQCLWQAQEGAGDPPTFVQVERDWIQVDPSAFWLDVAELESAFENAHTTSGELMASEQAEALAGLVDLYRGDLLEGWREQWCVVERERLKAMYLVLLEKLVGFCEVTGRSEEGLYYGERLLRHDCAHERTHWRMMRLSYLAGDRTGAIRQFERCRAALADQLGAEPGKFVTQLYEQVRADAGIVDLGSLPGGQVVGRPRRIS